MSRELRVVVEPAALERTKYGSIVGPVWVAADGDLAFPEAGWLDFPVVILGWWLGELDRFHRDPGATGDVTLAFMDGPWEIGLTFAPDLCTATLNRARPSVLNWRGPISRPVFLDSVRAGALEIFKECRRRGWEPAELAGLRVGQ